MQGSARNYTKLLDLSGRGFIVLGAGLGIGAETARALAQCGARVLCVDLDKSRAEEIASEVGGIPAVADVINRADVEKVFQVAKAQLGKINGIVDVIGAARIKPLSTFSNEELDWQFNIVLRHALLTLQLAATNMTEGGTVTFVGSMSGDRAVRDQIIYGTAKAALHHLVRGSATELGPLGIRVNAIAPGFIRTPRLLELLDAEQWAEIDRGVPTGRAATPQEIASALLFLSSDMASHVNGVVMPVDGGVSFVAALPKLRFGPKSRGEGIAN